MNAPAHPNIEGLRVGVTVQGVGDPVLLLHGWGADRSLMQAIVERLAADYETHALDLPGFGESDLPPIPWDVPHYGEFVRAYIEQAKLGRVRLIGHSFGGRLSIYLGATHPHLIQQIVLTDSAGVLPQRSPKMQLYYGFRRSIFTLLKLPLLNRAEPAVRRWLFNLMASPDAKQTQQNNDPAAQRRYETFKRVIAQDLVPLARQISAPTLLIWGENDADTPLRDAKILEASIPDAGLVIFEGAGHYAYLEQPDRFVAIVRHFFGS